MENVYSLSELTLKDSKKPQAREILLAEGALAAVTANLNRIGGTAAEKNHRMSREK